VSDLAELLDKQAITETCYRYGIALDADATIAGAVASTLRVAPALNQMLSIDDIYAFAAHLRAGSIRDTGAGS
jgi:hypothetical protein